MIIETIIPSPIKFQGMEVAPNSAERKPSVSEVVHLQGSLLLGTQCGKGTFHASQPLLDQHAGQLPCLSLLLRSHSSNTR